MSQTYVLQRGELGMDGTPKQGSIISGISDRLRRDISLGIIRPGDKLNIEALKREYNVSHPSVREALSLLVGEGYVGFKESKGFRALHFSQDEQHDIARVRAELECLALAWSIQATSVDWRSTVVAAHYALSEIEREMPADPLNAALEWDERNRTFHFALVGNCGSPKLLDLISAQYDLSRRYRLMAHGQDRSEISRERWVNNSSKEHEQLKQAVLESNIEIGQDVLRKHITKATLHSVDGRHATDDERDSGTSFSAP